MNKIRTSAIRTLLIAAIFVGAAAAVYAERSTIGDGIRNVTNLDWAWVAAASLAEVLSMLALALLYQAVLRANYARLTVAWILASSLIANGISISVPIIGSGMASLRQLVGCRRFFRTHRIKACLELSPALIRKGTVWRGASRSPRSTPRSSPP